MKYFQETNKVWKQEYKTAFQSLLSLRYMDGANLSQTKVIHFGPTLGSEGRKARKGGGEGSAKGHLNLRTDKATIFSIINDTRNFALPCEIQHRVAMRTKYIIFPKVHTKGWWEGGKKSLTQCR